ncbi:hypothetical protein [Helicobacter sp. 23-1045]
MTKKGVDCFGTSCLAMTDYFTHPLNPPPQGSGRGKVLDSAFRTKFAESKRRISRKNRRICHQIHAKFTPNPHKITTF